MIRIYLNRSLGQASFAQPMEDGEPEHGMPAAGNQQDAQHSDALDDAHKIINRFLGISLRTQKLA